MGPKRFKYFSIYSKFKKLGFSAPLNTIIDLHNWSLLDQV